MEVQTKDLGPVVVHAEGGATVAVSVNHHHYEWPEWLTKDTILALAEVIQRQREASATA